MKESKLYDFDNRITPNVANFNLMTILGSHFDGHNDYEPIYQRGNVWNPKQKISLIDSIFKDIEIGKIARIYNMRHRSRSKPYEILDGKQRILALAEYCNGEFAFQGYKYSELSNLDKIHFDMFTILCIEFRKDDMTPKRIYEYFLRLNTFGEPVDPAHIEKVRQLWLNAKE